MGWRNRLVRWSGFLGISLLTSFALLLLALHLIGASQGHVPRYLSHFGLEPYGWLWIIGMFLFAAGAACLSLAVWGVLPRSGWGRAALTTLATVPVFAVGIAVFPAAPPGANTTFIERLHEASAIGAFFSIGIAMLLTFAALRGHHRRLARASLAMGVLFVMLVPWSIRGFILGTPDVLYSERIVVTVHGLWLFSLGLWSRHVSGAQEATSAPPPTAA